jgi:hypothetical protein
MKMARIAGAIAGLMGVLPAVNGMTLNPRGVGQVLLYPYYTVNNHQQTLLSVANTTAKGKALRIRFREGYNGREVLDFNIFLAPHDIWTTVVFSLSDAGITGDGAAIAVSDQSCTQPAFAPLTTKLSDGRPYQPFLEYAYSDTDADTGPSDTSRTREGNFEIIEMGEITGATLVAIAQLNGPPIDCSGVQEASTIPTTDIGPPSGGLAGSAAIVNVAQGTMFAFNADAIDGFRDQALVTDSGMVHPNLSDGVSDSATGLATAYVPVAGRVVQMNYSADQAIDAVSALLMADQISTEWDLTPSAGVQTDWVITLPTKHFYTDPGNANTGLQLDEAIPPFPQLFGTPTAGRSDVTYGYGEFDREGNSLIRGNPIEPPPPPPATPGPLGYETQVMAILPSAQVNAAVSQVLGSHLISVFPIEVSFGTAGQVTLDTTALAIEHHELRPSLDGYAMQGLPVTGFAAINYINANVTPGVLSNYSGAYPTRATASCAAMSTPNPNSPCSATQ